MENLPDVLPELRSNKPRTQKLKMRRSAMSARKCTVKFVRVPKGRRHDTIELFAAQGQEALM